MNMKYILILIFCLVSISIYCQDGYKGLGPWNKIGTVEASMNETTDSYLNAKVVIGGENPIDNSDLSVYGNVENKGDLKINNSLILKTGATTSAVLLSDENGNTRWEQQDSNVVFRTIVAGTGGNTTFSFTTVKANITFFKNIIQDNVPSIFGSDYGWSTVTQGYKVPRSGLYKVSVNAFFQGDAANAGFNNRIYSYQNGNALYNAGIISITNGASSQARFITGIVYLNKDDIVTFGTASNGAGVGTGQTRAGYVILYGDVGHTYFIIESLN